MITYIVAYFYPALPPPKRILPFQAHYGETLLTQLRDRFSDHRDDLSDATFWKASHFSGAPVVMRETKKAELGEDGQNVLGARLRLFDHAQTAQSCLRHLGILVW